MSACGLAVGQGYEPTPLPEVGSSLFARLVAYEQPMPGEDAPQIEVDVVAPEPTNQGSSQGRPSPFAQAMDAAEAFSTGVDGAFLPDVQGTRIYSGKKTAKIDLQNRPPIVNNNFRQALAKTPGLLLSEESTPLLSIGYRGLPPHRTQFTQVLKDGIPIHADMFGYPEAYYTPPFQVIDHIDFIHGGASLMYGPQPGGALNFVTRDPYTDGPLAVQSEQAFGNFGFFSTYNALTGTIGPLGYYVYQHHRQAAGFRQSNSYYNVDYGGGKFIINLTPDSRWITNVDFYGEQHGEPGGLTLGQFNADPTFVSRPNDAFRLKRYSASLVYQEVVTDDVYFENKMWAIYYSRFSKRQNGGGFGTRPIGAASALASFELQDFYNFAFEPRLRRDWGEANTFTCGTIYYHTESPRRDTVGSVLENDSLGTGGNLRRLTDRTTNYFSVFAENRFKFSRLSITPGMRLENVWQNVQEFQDTAKTAAGQPLRNQGSFDFAPLFGLGATFDLFEQEKACQLYANISQAYRPKVFTEAFSLGVNERVSGDLTAGTSYQADLGVRGQPADWLTWDTSAFYLNFTNQIGTVVTAAGPPVITTFTNIGDTRHIGGELAVDFDILRFWDDLIGKPGPRYGSISIFHNSMFLDALIYRGLPTTQGATPQYAPVYTGRGGLAFTTEFSRVMLSGTNLTAHFANDSNTSQFFIPAYTVWDLTGQHTLFRQLSFIWGVNNIFDSQYFARIRNDGIDPAMPRNYYLGARLDY